MSSPKVVATVRIDGEPSQWLPHFCRMPPYRLNLHNAHYDAIDEEGVELTGIKEARSRAVDGIRDFIGHEAMGGAIDFRGHIDIVDDAGKVLESVAFRDAFNIKGI